MFEALFQWLFKYRPLVFEQGDFVLGASGATRVAVVCVALAATYALVGYARAARGTARDRALLIGARVAALTILAFALLRPALVLKAAVPQQNFLGVLIDDSRSMQIGDRGGQPRSEFVRSALGTPESPLLQALDSRFVLRPFRFSSSAERITSAAALTYGGTRTDLGGALERARDELAGLPLAGLVLVSDGADTSNAALDEPIASLKARQIPVFTVGVGQDRFARDIQISRIETPRAALKGTSLVVNVVVTQTGYAGARVPLQVEDEGRLVSSDEIALPPDGQSTTVPVRFTVKDAGPRVFRLRIPVQSGEQVTQNNQRDALIEVQDRRERILYFEGEPRPEAKFIRRAIDEDPNLQVVLLQRTAENKYLRLNVATPDELVAGFPKTRDELFAFRGVILGSVEASSFTPEQLRMLADFVSRRGGGLLMLGGRRAFAEGGWAGTPVGEVLPVVLDPDGGRRPAPYFSWLPIRPTRAGTMDPVTMLAGTPDASEKRWADMPPLSAVNAIRGVKPGATTLLTAVDARKTEDIVLAWQRYGRGKALAFPVQDSWLWRMDPKTPVTDTTHATFWRRMLRWLVDGVPDPVIVTTTADRVDPGEAVKLTAQVADSAYVEVNDSQVTAHVTSPRGRTVDVPMDWAVSRDGEYRASFVPDEEGVYQVRVTAERDGRSLGTTAIHVRSARGDAEYFDAAMRAPLLQRIANETGGRFFTPETAAGLADAISYTGRGVTVVEERDLWDMPVLLLLIVALVGGEWTYRRARGLA